MEKVMSWLEGHEADLIETYKELHKIPELGMAEHKTSAYLARELRNAGFTVTDGIGGTGIIAVLKGAEPGTNFALRADMDALPIEEKTGLPYASCHPGVMHACGHDAHSAMGLFAAKALAATGGIQRGTFTLVLQPGEETLEGARAIIDSGLLEGVDEIVGIHMRRNNEAKVGQARCGILHAACWRVEANIHGKAAHSAWIHNGINVLEAVAAIVNALNAIHADPGVSHSVKMTRCYAGGDAINIIPELARIAIDVRSQSNTVMEELREKTIRAIETGAASIGATAELFGMMGCPAAQFDDALLAETRASIAAVLGEENALPPVGSPGSEDFHCYAVEAGIKTAFVGIGGDMGTGGHTATMQLDLSSLLHGAKILAHIAKSKLG